MGWLVVVVFFFLHYANLIMGPALTFLVPGNSVFNKCYILKKNEEKKNSACYIFF